MEKRVVTDTVLQKHRDFLQDQHNDVETIWMVKTHKLLERINNMMLGITNIVI